jgi:hypothetical protein
MNDESEIRRTVMFLESLLDKIHRGREASLLTDAAGVAFIAAKQAVEKRGWKLSVSPGGITWRRAS